jgi:hypothetical protein
MQEGGHVLAELVLWRHLTANELLPGRADILAAFVSQAIKDNRKANPLETKGMAKFTQRALWELVALQGTDRQRLLMHPPTELAAGILAQSTDYKSNYRRQGMQFSLLAGQILEKLEARQRMVPTDGQPDAEAPASGRRKGKSRAGAPEAKESREERKIRETWGTGLYGTHEDCDDRLGIDPGTTKKTLDRLRQREKRRRQKTDEMDEIISSDVEQEK